MTALEVAREGRKADGGLTIREAVEYLKHIGMKRISVQTLYNKINLGVGPRREKQGGIWVFKPADLDAWKKQQTEGFDAYEK